MKLSYCPIGLWVLFLLFCTSCKKEKYERLPQSNNGVYESGEELLAGKLTINSQSINAFGRAIPGLSNTDEIAFGIGNSLFNQSWVSAPASTTGRDGLGPTFNSRACSSCHSRDGRGFPLLGEQSDLGSTGFLMRISLPGTSGNGGPNPVPHYGTQIQD